MHVFEAKCSNNLLPISLKLFDFYEVNGTVESFFPSQNSTEEHQPQEFLPTPCFVNVKFKRE